MDRGASDPYRILILGGYGHFGGRIGRALADSAELIVAGRDAAKAQAAAHALGAAHRGVALDHSAPDLVARLRALRAHLVIHTCGPFQGQSYHVAQACIEAGTHYIDLADGRAFVAGIGALDAAARANGVLVISGASTLPALSAAVIDAHLARFSRLDTIDISIAPGHRAPRGIATLKAVLSYCGKPFSVWERHAWHTAYGWQGLHRFWYPDVGARCLARCDVPDLELFPARYAGVARVRFDAALELALAQGVFWLLAAAVRLKLIRDASRYAAPMARWADRLDRWGKWGEGSAWGTDSGAMHVGLSGVDHHGHALRLAWQLTAKSGHGPHIPTVPAIVLARKFAADSLAQRGALPCMGLMTLADFAAEVHAARLDIAWRVLDS